MKPLTQQQTLSVTGGAAVVAKMPFGANKLAGFDPMLSEPTKNTGSGWFVASLVEPLETDATAPSKAAQLPQAFAS
jgi:hypothetical protein